MMDPEITISELIRAARSRSEALGDLLERYRGFLRIVAEHEIGRALQRRVDASDAVQQTFLDAQRGFAEFAGRSEPELSAWLKQILRYNIAGFVRDHVATPKRAVGRERSIYDAEDSAVLTWHEPPAGDTSPSSKMIRGEKAIRIAQLLESLPADQGEAVRLRHLEGRSIKEIAEHFGRQPTAVAGLLKRGLKSLRAKMTEQSWL
jgi:RNA polymerase sigma-70 factor (ECF subfamily)